MGASETRRRIEQAVERLRADLPALERLRLVAQLELRARGSDAPIWRVELPALRVTREPAADARLYIELDRDDFNRLAGAGLEDWAEAFRRGRVRVTGDPAVIKLLGEVARRALSRRAGTRKRVARPAADS
ncbi:SCP2 sterol-binding domain-containing protein [Thermoleophilum album]|uniref:SCP-2 sterol transfer family protein n=1 Tax=Thermoleophilum album TaxID=29539 RepID=A0A1H6G142_THEAL|nr:SCP2 sterol-binding domain-containing protein [Thermoleophilum album]SEH15714.1 SCP-2 sterol transfer family protein [Thermoleophilum album]